MFIKALDTLNKLQDLIRLKESRTCTAKKVNH